MEGDMDTPSAMLMHAHGGKHRYFVECAPRKRETLRIYIPVEARDHRQAAKQAEHYGYTVFGVVAGK